MNFEPTYVDETSGLAAYLYHDEYASDPRKEFDYWGDDDVAAYESGDVYGIVIAPIDSTNPLTDQVASCWGFYGYDYALGECAGMIADAAHDREWSAHYEAKYGSYAL